LSGLDDLEWSKVKPGSVWLGSDDGRLSFHPVKESPRHEVRIDYEFEISRDAFHIRDFYSESGTTKEELDEAGVRMPSEAEWELANDQRSMHDERGGWEELADSRPRSGHWGGRCDGHPRETSHLTQVTPLRRWGGEGVERSHDHSLSDAESRDKVMRLVRAPNPPEEAPRLPEENKTPLLLREAVFALGIGIIPSFLWAWRFASTRYLTDGWFNLVFGGLFIGVVSGFVWRPKRPSYRVSEDGSTMERV
jgi:hypothetical protein